MHKTAIVDEYLSKRDDLDRLATSIMATLGEALSHHEVKIHDLSYRLKSRESLESKLSRPDKIYRELGDVTDLVGVRIITYFEDSIDEVAEVLEGLFEIDLERSIDRRQALAAEAFGYQSIHYICQISREGLTEALDPWLVEVKFEVQVRTILQHAWAEIEHDLGYKSQALVPRSVRRRFSRLAGLLELADEEFVSTKKALAAYEHALDQDPGDVGGGSVPLDLLSLRSCIRSGVIASVDAQLAQTLNTDMSDQLFFPDYLIRMLDVLGVRTIEDLTHRVQSRREEILAFVSPYLAFTRDVWGFDEDDIGVLPLGYSVLLAGHLEVLGSHQLALKRIEEATRFFHALDYRDDESAARQVAKDFVERFKAFSCR